MRALTYFIIGLTLLGLAVGLVTLNLTLVIHGMFMAGLISGTYLGRALERLLRNTNGQ